MMRQITVILMCVFYLLAGSASAVVWMDDFEREEIGEDWTQAVWWENAPPDWKIEDGVLKGRWPRWNAQMIFLKEYPSLDYTIQVKGRIDKVLQFSGYEGFAIVFRSSGPGANPRDKITPFYCFGPVTSCAKFLAVPGGGNFRTVAIKPKRYHIDQWYTLKLIAKDDKFLGYVDDKLVCDLRDRQFKEKFVGLATGCNVDVSFDDFMISDQVDEDAILHFDVSPEGTLTTTWAGLKAR